MTPPKEIASLGKALKALVKVGAMEEVKEIIDCMADIDQPRKKENDE